MEKQLHISLAPETIFSIQGFNITNSMLTTLLVTLVLFLFALKATSNAKISPTSHWQQIAEMIVEMMQSLTDSIAGKFATKVFPLVTTIFLFVIMSNWIGLLPGVGSIYVNKSTANETVTNVETENATQDPINEEVSEHTQAPVSQNEHAVEAQTHKTESHLPPPLLRAPSADVNMTLALAIIAFLYTQITGISALGLGKYGKKFFDFTSPINAFVGILEFIGEFSKIISYTFRLFGNIFAGEVLLAVMAFLSPIFFPILPLPFLGLELFVGFIQAYVFAILVTIFATLARESHSDAHH